jgi:hypothetical protein
MPGGHVLRARLVKNISRMPNALTPAMLEELVMRNVAPPSAADPEGRGRTTARSDQDQRRAPRPALLPQAKDALTARRDRLAADHLALALGEAWQDTGLIVTTRTGPARSSHAICPGGQPG